MATTTLQHGDRCPRCGGPLAQEPLDPALVCLECHRQYWLLEPETAITRDPYPRTPAPANQPPAPPVHCAVCQVELGPPAATGSPRMYCSRSCRDLASRRNRKSA